VLGVSGVALVVGEGGEEVGVDLAGLEEGVLAAVELVVDGRHDGWYGIIF
jgi:hypothetical protein